MPHTRTHLLTCKCENSPLVFYSVPACSCIRESELSSEKKKKKEIPPAIFSTARVFLSLALKLRENPDHQHKSTECQESPTVQQKPASHRFTAMSLQPCVNVKDSIRAMNLISSHAFNHAQAFYGSDARPACAVVIDMHVRDRSSMGACGARRTPLTASV